MRCRWRRGEESFCAPGGRRWGRGWWSRGFVKSIVIEVVVGYISISYVSIRRSSILSSGVFPGVIKNQYTFTSVDQFTTTPQDYCAYHTLCANLSPNPIKNNL